ncbi:MAG: ABC transporter permease [Thermoflexales bacterium]|nr:ABC transporter permease [Thermoflexales bacterium]
MSNSASPARSSSLLRDALVRVLDRLSMPALALFTAFLLGAIVIWLTSGKPETVLEAYGGLLRGAFVKQRGLSESLVATVPYILLSLAVAVGFKAGLFNIGAEGQFYIGALCAAWAGQAVSGLPALIHLPLALLAGAAGGAVWAAIPGYLKARTGAHEVISTMMMNYVAFRLAELVISGPLKDDVASTVQTPRVSTAAELWTFAAVPARLRDPLNALAVALLVAFTAWLVARAWKQRADVPGAERGLFTRYSSLIIAGAAGLVTFFGLPALAQLWWPFQDKYDRLHIGLLLALAAAVGVWWLLWHTTTGFELRMVGANPNAARYAGVSITRNIILAMSISGALAGLAGTAEVLGVSTCRCLPLFFSSGYGFDSIAIALLGNNHPFGIVLASFLFGAMRNGADLMELSSGVSKYVISVIQAVMLLFVAAPAVVRWLYRIKAAPQAVEEEPLTRGWGG